MGKRRKYKLIKKEVPKTKTDSIKIANRYFSNAKETLNKSPIEYKAYQDSKYVCEACAMAYLATLKAIDGYLVGSGIPETNLPDTHIQYTEAIKKIPKNACPVGRNDRIGGKLMNFYNIVYQNLHLLGYYRGGVSVNMIKDGFGRAKEIIEMLAK